MTTIPATTGQAQMSLPLGMGTDVGNKPVLMIFRLFGLNPGEGCFTAKISHGDTSFELKIESDDDLGIATQADNHFLQVVMTKMAEMKKAQGHVPTQVRISVVEYLNRTGQKSSGYAYHSIGETIRRLQQTKIYANFQDKKSGVSDYFSWLDRGSVHYVKKHDPKTGEEREGVTAFTVQPCHWIRAIIEENSDLLMYNPDYFGLKSSYVQRLYEVANAHVTDKIFKVSLEKLMDLCGVDNDPRQFKKNLYRQVAAKFSEGNPIPDHAMYPYKTIAPEKSRCWGDKIQRQHQYYVFVRGEPQEDVLDVHLDEIPEWEAQMSLHDINAMRVASGARG